MLGGSTDQDRSRGYARHEHHLVTRGLRASFFLGRGSFGILCFLRSDWAFPCASLGSGLNSAATRRLAGRTRSRIAPFGFKSLTRRMTPAMSFERENGEALARRDRRYSRRGIWSCCALMPTPGGYELRTSNRDALARGQGAFGFPEDRARGGPGSTVAFGAPCGEARALRAPGTGAAPLLTH